MCCLEAPLQSVCCVGRLAPSNVLDILIRNVLRNTRYFVGWRAVGDKARARPHKEGREGKGSSGEKGGDNKKEARKAGIGDRPQRTSERGNQKKERRRRKKAEGEEKSPGEEGSRRKGGYEEGAGW